MAKEITRDVYLKALGLMTLGNSYSRKADECRDELEALLDVPETDRGMSHFGDELYSSDPDLDDALRKADYVVTSGDSSLRNTEQAK